MFGQTITTSAGAAEILAGSKFQEKRMTRKGEVIARENLLRGKPHHVRIPLPETGFGTKSDDMLAFCRAHDETLHSIPSRLSDRPLTLPCLFSS
jgi:hypothetical protein